jgi:hypothetical protein
VVQAVLARLEPLEKDNAGAHEPIDLDDDDEASPDEDEQRPHPKKQAKGSKRKTRQAKALERVALIKKAPRNFLDLLQEVSHFCFYVDCDSLSLCLSICLSLIIIIVINSALVHEMCIGDRY